MVGETRRTRGYVNGVMIGGVFGDATMQLQQNIRNGNANSVREGNRNNRKSGPRHTNNSLYKTELCMSFQDTQACRYGDKCQFAHGEHERRPLSRHPKYKTEVCRAYRDTGMCPYGARCRFIHSSADGEEDNYEEEIAVGASTTQHSVQLNGNDPLARVQQMYAQHNHNHSVIGDANNLSQHHSRPHPRSRPKGELASASISDAFSSASPSSLRNSDRAPNGGLVDMTSQLLETMAALGLSKKAAAAAVAAAVAADHNADRGDVLVSDNDDAYHAINAHMLSQSLPSTPRFSAGGDGGATLHYSHQQKDLYASAGESSLYTARAGITDVTEKDYAYVGQHVSTSRVIQQPGQNVQQQNQVTPQSQWHLENSFEHTRLVHSAPPMSPVNQYSSAERRRPVDTTSFTQTMSAGGSSESRWSSLDSYNHSGRSGSQSIDFQFGNNSTNNSNAISEPWRGALSAQYNNHNGSSSNLQCSVPTATARTSPPIASPPFHSSGPWTSDWTPASTSPPPITDESISAPLPPPYSASVSSSSATSAPVQLPGNSSNGAIWGPLSPPTTSPHLNSGGVSSASIVLEQLHFLQDLKLSPSQQQQWGNVPTSVDSNQSAGWVDDNVPASDNDNSWASVRGQRSLSGPLPDFHSIVE